MARNKAWFRMEKKSDDYAEIEIFDEIDAFWGIGPKEFKAKLDEIKGAKSIKLFLNSPGGSVFDGMAICNILAAHRDKLDIEVVGLAASIASIIALAGRKLTMAEGSYYMIHNPLTIMIGDANELRKTADLLDKMKGEFISTYKKKSGKDEQEISDMMDAETWLTASEAIEAGFADDSEDYGQIAAKLDGCKIAKHFARVPEEIARNKQATKLQSPRDLEDLLRDSGGMSRSEAVAIVASGWKALEQGEPAKSEQGEPAKKPTIDNAIKRREAEIDYEVRRVLG
jgi:ATP-dependent Clp endopeptidase proteolytic subunit ClpP